MQQRKELKVVLVESFKELALEEPVDKITIKEITDRAGVIRVTFYNHFQDKYELIEWMILTQILEPVEILLKNEMYREAMLLIFTNIVREKDLYLRLYRMGGQVPFDSIIKKCIHIVLHHFLLDHIGDKRLKYDWLSVDNIADYYTQSMAFVINGWLQTGLAVSPQEMAELYEYLAHHSMFDLMDDLS